MKKDENERERELVEGKRGCLVWKGEGGMEELRMAGKQERNLSTEFILI